MKDYEKNNRGLRDKLSSLCSRKGLSLKNIVHQMRIEGRSKTTDNLRNTEKEEAWNFLSS